MLEATHAHHLVQHRHQERARIARCARDMRTAMRGHVMREKINAFTRDLITREAPPEKPTLPNLRREITARLAGLTEAAANPPRNLPCGADDAWYDRLAYATRETHALAQHVAEQSGIDWERERFLTDAEHRRAGTHTCPYCLSTHTLPAGEPMELSPYRLDLQRECRDCRNGYTVTYRFGHPEEEAFAPLLTRDDYEWPILRVA